MSKNILTLAGLFAASWFLLSTPAAAQSCSANAVTAENCLAGNSASEWDVAGAGDTTIQGFATSMSVNRGGTISFKVDTPAASYHFDIYRMGYYGGLGARKVDTVQPSVLGQNQPQCLTNTTTGLVDCGNWDVSGSWTVPANSVSGIYFARLVRDDTGGASHIMFVVRDDASHSDLLYKTSDTTWQAYNDFGGNSLYVGAPAGRAYKVSYNRPLVLRGNQYRRASPFATEYPFVRWMEANGYDVAYTSSVDAAISGSLLRNHKTLLSVGHDEYWSGEERTNFEAARDAGVNLAFFSGNEMFWKTRWEPSIDSSATAYRTLVSYKETHANDKIDPTSTWTGTWRDARFSPPADGGRPENAVTGTLFMVNCCEYSTPSIMVPAAEGKMRLWRNTSVATMFDGDFATLAAGSLGYEWDIDADNGFRPPGAFRVSKTVRSGINYLLDNGSNYTPGNGTGTHAMVMYRASSGALVFGAGTVRWSWGLDVNHDIDDATPFSATVPDARMQQATVNLLADMGAQAATLQSDLVAASASTDHTAPVSTITNPASGGGVTVGDHVVISGTAVDSGGGVVGGVEVSLDGGATWHPAEGRGSWTYVWAPTAPGSITIKTRAADDSGNLEASGPSRTVSIAPLVCPCTVQVPGATPQLAADNEGVAVEVGVKFKSDQDGYVTGVRFYKGPGNTGAHVGNLWSLDGTRLATATFTAESASGWQQVDFAAPVAIAANTVYVASYFAPVGHFSADSEYFKNSGRDRGMLYFLQDGESGGNSVYAYGSTSSFPTETYNSNYYWIDVVYNSSATDTSPPTIPSHSPASSATNVPASSTVSVVFSESMATDSISTSSIQLRDASNTVVPATVSYDSITHTATLTPSAALTAGASYSATVLGGSTDPRVKDAAGNALASTANWSFTVATAVTCPCTGWDPSAAPTFSADPDDSAVTLGVKFKTTIDGYITGVRFYKGAGNTGTHVGSLWTSGGTLLTSATFSGETAGGWQQVSFAAPIAVTANTVYVVSYNAPNGHYSVDSAYFSSGGVDRGPLHFLSSVEGSGNGVFAYGSGNTFPNQSYNANHYWVDAVFDTVGSTTPPPTYNCPCTGWDATATPGIQADSDSDSLELGVKFSSAVSGHITGIRFYKGSGNTGTHTATLWSSTGTPLGTATFSGESASGWQQVNFSTPIAITANTVYVASYLAPNGHYSADPAYFANSAVDRGPLHFLQGGEAGGNGVFIYGSGGLFPNQSYQSNHYWVDVVFSP
jgi:hypothetical protein